MTKIIEMTVGIFSYW